MALTLNKNYTSASTDSGKGLTTEQKIYQNYLDTMNNKAQYMYPTNPVVTSADTVNNGNGTVTATAPNGQTANFATQIKVPTSNKQQAENNTYNYSMDSSGNLTDNTVYVPATPDPVDTSNNDDAYQKAMNDLMETYRIAEQRRLAEAQAAEDARMAALQKNYELAMSNARDSFNSGKDTLRNSYELTMNNALNNYNTSRDTLQERSDEALRQAYINYMLSQRGINQQLSNGGINGGATESILANLYNSYGNNRAGIQNELAGNLANLLTAYNNTKNEADNSYQTNLANLVDSYNNRVASLGSDYNENYADALADFSNIRANAISDYDSNIAKVQQNYANALAQLLAKNDTSSATSTTANDAAAKERRTSDINVLASIKNNPTSIYNYIQTLRTRYTDDEIDQMLWDANIDVVEFYKAMSGQPGSTTGAVTSGANAVSNAIENIEKTGTPSGGGRGR